MVHHVMAALVRPALVVIVQPEPVKVVEQPILVVVVVAFVGMLRLFYS